MNINDIAVEELWSTAVKLYKTEDPLEIIFARQRELMEKYLVLEAILMNEPKITVPIDIHSPLGQQTLKARAWWITEELVEALDALSEEGDTKFLEEMSDALHFMTELWILADLDPSTIWTPINSISCVTNPPVQKYFLRLKIMDLITNLGRAMWQLRNKPWKKSQVLTDIPQFSLHMRALYGEFLRFLTFYFGLNLKQICLLYLRKSEVNKFRQRSRY